MKRSWNIGTVVDNADPDKRRRLKLRFNNQADIDDDHLLWVNALPIASEHFDLPDKDDKVFVIILDDLTLWTYLPDKSIFGELSDDDYATAFIRKHKDVLDVKYEESNGWTGVIKKNIAIETEKTKTTIKEDKIEFEFDKVKVETDGSSVAVKVNQVEFSTDGSKATLKNASVNLADVINDLETALQTHQHPTATGQSGPPMNVSDFITNQLKFKQLLQ